MNKLFINYLKTKRWMHFDLKAVIFDMDGVLYDSMPAHDLSWREAMDEFGLKYLPNEFFLQEGRLGHATINAIFQRNLNRESTSEEEEKIYARKSELFANTTTMRPCPVHVRHWNTFNKRGSSPSWLPDLDNPPCWTGSPPTSRGIHTRYNGNRFQRERGSCTRNPS